MTDGVIARHLTDEALLLYATETSRDEPPPLRRREFASD